MTHILCVCRQTQWRQGDSSIGLLITVPSKYMAMHCRVHSGGGAQTILPKRKDTIQINEWEENRNGKKKWGVTFLLQQHRKISASWRRTTLLKIQVYPFYHGIFFHLIISEPWLTSAPDPFPMLFNDSYGGLPRVVEVRGHPCAV